MPDRVWKVAERRTASTIGGKRNPLSGSNSQHTSCDVIHPTLYAEVKYRKRFGVLAALRDAIPKARDEGKLPVLILQERGNTTQYFVVRDSDLPEFVRIMLEKYVSDSLTK